MSERYVFDPRDTRYKTPFGAVECGTEVRFTLRPLAREGFVACTLLAWQEFGFYSQEIELSSPGEGLFTGTFTAPADPDLVWYGFRFTRADGQRIWLGKNGYGPQQAMISWQLTVYDGKSTTPEWFGSGVTYQIFPDRFCRYG